MQAVAEANGHRGDAIAIVDAWYTDQCERAGRSTIELETEYVQRLRDISAKYEQDVEPHRLKFLAENPGQRLPAFLLPGFRADTDAEPTRLPVATKPSDRRGIKLPRATVFRVVVLVVAVVLIVAGVISYKANDGARKAAEIAAVESVVEALLGPNEQQKAEGFNHTGEGVLFRWATDEEEKSAKANCISGLSCFVATVELNGDCPGGIYIELKLKDKNGNVVGMANEKTPAMYKGDRGVFAVSAGTKAPSASLAKTNCN